MASEMIDGATDNLVELIVRDEPPSMADGGPILEEIAPLLTQAEKPKINIFTISYPRRKPMVKFTFLAAPSIILIMCSSVGAC